MTTSRRLLSSIVLVVLIVVCSDRPTAQGQPKPPAVNPNAPTLKGIGPGGAQRGTTLDLVLTGTNLNEPTGVWLNFPAKATIPTEGNNGKDATKLTVRLEIPKDAPVGTHALRLATTRGVSNVRLFCVDDLPQVMSNNNNRTKATAQELKPLPCVVVGKVTAETNDYYKIAVAAGQRLSFEVLGRRLGGPIDPQLTLIDAKTGRELPGGHSNDSPGLQTDCRLTYTFKTPGDVLVEVRDVSYRGGEDYLYRLRIGDFPCATTPLPMAAKRGTKATIQFAGPAVDGVAPVEVDVPNQPGVDAVYVAPKNAAGLHGWPVCLAISDLDEKLEQEPNNEPAKANRVPVPGAVTGRFETKGDIDHFVFSLKKGQRVLIDAHSGEFGSPTEVYMVLRDAKGAQVGATNPANPPRIDFNPPEDGDFTLSIEHLLYSFGPAETYRVTIVPYQPGFDLNVLLDRFEVAQDGSVNIPVTVVRRDYTGPIELSVVGPAGLTGQATVAMGQPPANQPVQLPVKAGGPIPMGPTTFLVQGKASINGKDVVMTASVRAPLSVSLAGLPIPPRNTFNDVGLAVLERAPFTLAAKFDEAAAAPGKPTMLTVTVTRTAGFNGDVALTLTGLPANVTAMPKSIPAGMNEAKVTLTLAANAAVGAFPITVNGKSKHNGRDVAINAAPVTLTVKK
jgi:hypothetical protein